MAGMRDAWSQLAGQLSEAGWDGQPLRLQHDGHVVTLDLHAGLEGKASEVVTRLRVAFANPERFVFRVFRRSLGSDLASLFGAQDVEVGDPAFDRNFVLRSNDPDRLRRIFEDPGLGARLQASAVRLVEIRDDEGWFGEEFPEGIDELYVEAEGRVTEPERLERGYSLIADLFDRILETRPAG